ncbi:MAG: thiamine pyrophosphate-dependent enzyme, partial [Stackebrandtia sp.]
AAVALAEAAGWPVLAEPASNARRGPNALTCYPLLLRSRALRERLRVQQAVTVGRPTTSRSVLDLLADAEHHTVVHPTRQWADPVRTADRVAPAATVAADRACATEWLAAWQAADHAARHAVDEVLTGDDALTEARLARDLPATLDAGAMLFLGSSMAVRAVDMFMSPRRDIRLMANRGLSGIDGSVSTAVGAALAHRRLGGGPACALLGDLTFLHDQNGLVLGPHDARPDLTIIVINNNGGGIFSLLPYQRLGAEFERLFGTPHDVSLSAVADAAGWKYEQVTHASQLSSALRSGGPRIVEVRTDRSATAAQYEHLHAAVDRALAVGPV